jgi:hypothetical protein
MAILKNIHGYHIQLCFHVPRHALILLFQIWLGICCYVVIQETFWTVLERFRTTSDLNPFWTRENMIRCSKADSNPFRTRENMIRCSHRTISMVIYALDPISVIRFYSVFLESSSRTRFLTYWSSHSIISMKARALHSSWSRTANEQ